MGRATAKATAASRRAKWLLSAASVLVLSLAAEAARAQTINLPPVHTTVDANGVDLVSGAFDPTTPNLTIGNPGAGGLTLSQIYLGPTLYTAPTWNTNLDCFATSNGAIITLNIGLQSETFTVSGSSASSQQGTGNSIAITGSGATLTYTLTRRDGSVFVFNPGRLTTATYPNGQVDTYNYAAGSWVQGGVPVTSYRLQSVTNNLGYQIHIQYSTDTLAGDGSNLPAWLTRTGATGLNNAVDYCAPTAGTCTGLTTSWPTVTYGTPAGATGATVTDSLSRTTTFFASPGGIFTNGLITSVQRPSGLTTSVTYDANNRVTSVTNGTGTWWYNFTVSGTTGTAQVRDPNAGLSTYVSNLTLGLITSATDPLSHTTTYGYDTLGRLTSVSLPEGNGATVTYDSATQGVTRGNPVTVTRVAKSGSGLTNTSVSASYDSTCTAPAKCNEPNTITDAKSAVTSYTYDTTTGLPLTVTSPAPTTGAIQPQTRLGYTATYAYYKNSGGSIVVAASPVTLLTSVSACQTQAAASCPGTADETKTTIVYGAPSTANNLLPTSATSGAGDGSLTSTASMTYTAVGDLATQTGPLGAGQTTNYFYDADRERTGTTYPNPGVAEGLSSRAEKYSYSPDGLLTEAEEGHDTSQTDSTFATFTSVKQVTTTLDGLDRPAMLAVTGGGTTFNVVQYSYDTANRLICTAVRMNPTVFGTISTTSACSLGTAGSYGSDQITTRAYDADDRVTQTIVGYATAAQSTVSTSSYSVNGLVATVLDANNNLTTYGYDGFDRPAKLSYPSPTLGAGVSSTTDYETYAYDANDNPTSIRKRSADTLTLSYDALNRLTERAVPSWSGSNVFYSYDLLNRTTAAAFGSATGTPSDLYAYDALSRVTSQTTAGVTMASQYDAAGDRTRITWPDGFYATYVYDYMVRPTDVYDSSSNLLAHYAYNARGQLVGVTGGNGAVSTASWDSGDRRSSVGQSFTNTASNVSWTLSYNPANQIVSRVSTNDTYSVHPSAQSQTYTSNGLNQYSAVSGTSYSYDTRGNLTSDGVRTFTYDVDNHMLTGSAPSSLQVGFDPAGRRMWSEAAGATTPVYFVYDGEEPVEEYSAGLVLRRYVPSGLGETPLMWYEGTDESSPRLLHADNQGSVMAYSDASGNEQLTYGYDPFGGPLVTGAGHYTFTGQTSYGAVSVYNYKARTYDPVLGRFMNADPIGQAGDVNVYAYTRNDPINSIDPSGRIGVDGDPCSEGLASATCVGDVTVLGPHRPPPDYNCATFAAACAGALQNVQNYQELLKFPNLNFQVAQDNTKPEEQCHPVDAVDAAGQTVAKLGEGFVKAGELFVVGGAAEVAAAGGPEDPLALPGLAAVEAGGGGVEFGATGVVLGHLASGVARHDLSHFVHDVVADAIVDPLPLSPSEKEQLEDAAGPSDGC